MTNQRITISYTEPPYFRLDVAEAYKHVRMAQTDDGISANTKARTYHHLRALTHPTFMLKELQGISMTYARTQSGVKTNDEMYAFVHSIGGWFSGEALDKDFIDAQLKKGETFSALYKDEPFYAAAFYEPPEIDDDFQDLVEIKAEQMCKGNYSMLFLETKSKQAKKLFGENSVICNLDDRYSCIGLVANQSREQLIKQGHDEKTITKIEKELKQFKLQLNLFKKAEGKVLEDIAKAKINQMTIKS